MKVSHDSYVPRPPQIHPEQYSFSSENPPQRRLVSYEEPTDRRGSVGAQYNIFTVNVFSGAQGHQLHSLLPV